MSSLAVTLEQAPTLTVTVEEQDGLDVVQVEISGPAGPPGGQWHVHDQTIPAAVWTIDHDLGRYPPVQVVDSAGDQVFGDVDYPSLNRVVVTFIAPFSGVAHIG